jgi:hypothetical protein
MNHLCTDKENIRILEVGGGYGRLCEGIMNVFGNQTTYLLADSVPVSIMYSYLFLRKTLPNKKIGLYYSSANVNIEDYDCYIVPTWRMEDICEKSKLNFDLLINIQSMQEMTQWHVDYYLDFFNRYARLDSFIYLNNNEEYIFKGDWNYPTNWRMLTRHQTPWSWSENCPTTIYQKKAKNMTVWNSLVSYEHQSNVNTRMSVKSQKRKIQEIYSSLTQTRQRVIALEENKKAMETEIEGLNSSLSKMREENKEQEIKIIKLEEINTVGVNTIKDLNMKQAKLMKSYSQLEEKIESQKKIEGQYKDQIKDLKKKEAQLAAVLNSTSWKITEPIRKIIDKIRLPKKH